MTVIVTATEETARRVVDVLSDREVRVAATIADARHLLGETEPTIVLVGPSLLDGDGPDLLAAVRTDDDDVPTVPVLELVDADADTDDAATTDGTGEADAAEGSTDGECDDRVSIADPDALRTAVRLAIAVNEYRAATNAFYDLCRRRTADESTDPQDLADARRTAGDRLVAVQRVTGGRTPFGRLLAE